MAVDEIVRAILDAAPVPLAAIDASGAILHAGPAARALLGNPDVERLDGGPIPGGRLVVLVDRRRDRLLDASQRLSRAGAWELELDPGSEPAAGDVYWSAEMYRMVGRAPSELPPDPSTFHTIVEPADHERIGRALTALITAGEPYRVEYRLRRDDGATRVVRSVAELAHLPSGRVRITGIVQDITDIEESRASWDALIRFAPDIIFRLTRDGAIEFTNRAWGAELVGTPWALQAPPEYHDRVAATVAQVVATGTAGFIEIPRPQPDGRTRWYACHVGPIQRGAAIDGVIVVARDITPRRQAEQQLTVADRLASVGTMAAGVAHEINNPLASLIANLELALRETPTEPLRDAAQAAERVREIVRDLKVFARSEDERRGPVDVRRVLETTLRMAGNEIRHRATLELDLQPVPAVEANEARLAQVFLNLLINAAQAIREGDAARHRIRVSTEVAGGRVVVRVRDTGSGIPIDQQHRIFTPFFTTKPVGTGTGLGLSISHRIVTALGGELDFTSSPAGTEFRVALPAVAAVEAAPARKRTTGAPARRGRVLVVDDEPLITRAVRRILGTQHDVTTADNGAQALDAIRRAEHPFDVILCDLMMPVMSGMDLHAELAGSADAARLVFMTGGAFTSRAREFLAAVENPRVDKPFDAGSLRALINGLLR